MSLENIDNFINDFSHKINILIKYEYNNSSFNSNKHHLLFNHLLLTLFKRKKYGLDHECWKELYLRSLCFYKYQNKLSKIPLVLVTKHNEILPFYFKNKIHTTNNTLIHWDTHPDFNYIDQSYQLPKIYNQYLKSNNSDLITKAQKIVWDIGAANTGVFMSTGIRDTVWNMPSWIPDKQMNLNYFFKESKNSLLVCTNSNIKGKPNLEEFTQNKNHGETMKTYAKIQAEKLSKDGLKNMVNLIEKNGNEYILDIDLDYFVCNGKSFTEKYWKDSYDLSSPNRTETKDFYHNNPREFNKDNKLLIKYENDIQKEIKEINKRIKHFLNVLKYLKKKGYEPSHISICDSTNVHFSGCQTCNSVSNNYVPLNLALYVHTKVINGLEKIFD